MERRENPGIVSKTFKIKFDDNWYNRNSILESLILPRFKIHSFYSEIDTKEIIGLADIFGKEEKLYIDKILFNELIDYRDANTQSK